MNYFVLNDILRYLMIENDLINMLVFIVARRAAMLRPLLSAGRYDWNREPHSTLTQSTKSEYKDQIRVKMVTSILK